MRPKKHKDDVKFHGNDESGDAEKQPGDVEPAKEEKDAITDEENEGGIVPEDGDELN